MFVADLATCYQRGPQGGRLQTLDSGPDTASQSEGEIGLGFESRIPLAVIVVDNGAVESAQKAGEMIKTVPVVPADGGVERHGELLDKRSGRKRTQQKFTLAQDFRRGPKDPVGVGFGRVADGGLGGDRVIGRGQDLRLIHTADGFSEPFREVVVPAANSLQRPEQNFLQAHGP